MTLLLQPLYCMKRKYSEQLQGRKNKYERQLVILQNKARARPSNQTNYWYLDVQRR
jgi:hypothetical protein